MTFFRRSTLTGLILGAVLASPSLAERSGAYLAGRIAGHDADFDAASLYFSRAFLADPENIALRAGALEAFVADGSFAGALPIAQLFEDGDIPSEVARIVTTVADIQNDAVDDLLSAYENGRSAGVLIDDLVLGWAYVGRDDLSSAITAFNRMGTETGLEQFSRFHKALAFALSGDFGAADAVLSGDETEGPVVLTRRGVLVHAQILAALDRFDDAAALLDDRFRSGIDREIDTMRAAMKAGTFDGFDAVTSYVDGVAEVFYMLSEALTAEDAGGIVPLQYVRTAIELRPGHADAILLASDHLSKLERYGEAAELLETVPSDHIAFQQATLARAIAEESAGDLDLAISTLEMLAGQFPDGSQVHLTLGLKYAKQKNYEAATGAYDRALDLMGDLQRNHWFAYFERAISFERRGMWPEAESDFRQALDLFPNQPSVLNYLGYSMLEQNINLDEALSLIEQAVALRPDSGYIIDSLGWAYFLQGRFDDAVEPMERAAELEAIDPTINDHLGDVYWAVGRAREAEFQWKRALSFDPADDVVDRIRLKLDLGLDAVREQEGLGPTRIGYDG